MNWTVTLNVLIRLLPTVADSVYTARRDATKHFRRVAASGQAVWVEFYATMEHDIMYIDAYFYGKQKLLTVHIIRASMTCR